MFGRQQRAKVFKSADSLPQQYDLRQQALALGWTADRVKVIDSDVGQSAPFALHQVSRSLFGGSKGTSASCWLSIRHA